MKLPLVSRRAYDLLLEQRDRLLERENELVDHLKRVARREAGMPEVPRENKPAPKVKIPADIAHYIRGFESAATRSSMEEDYRRAIQGGMDPDTVRETWQIPGE